MIKDNSIKYYALTVIVPVIGIFTVFTFAFMYIHKEKSLIKSELKGLYQIEYFQELVFDIQKISISHRIAEDKDSIDELEKQLLKKLKYVDKNIKLKVSSKQLKDQIDIFIKDVNIFLNVDIKDKVSACHDIFKDLSRLLHMISFDSKLISNSNVKSHLLIKSIIITLPPLIEHNSRITQMMVDKQKDSDILIELAKINDRLNMLRLDMQMIKGSKEFNIVNTVYNNMLSSQNSTELFIQENFLTKKDISFKDIINLTQNNLGFIKLMYQEVIKALYKNLEKEDNGKTNILYFIVIIGLSSILFILFLNYKFYQKNKELLQTMKGISITDSMTNIYNRRYFDDIFPKQLFVHKRNRTNLVFIILDIDYFKQYNDTYGHKAGDDALQAVAQTLKRSLKRAEDMVFRLGGEEFGVICGDMNEKKAEIFANKLRMNILNMKLEHKKNTASPYLTISLGVMVVEPYFNYESDFIYKFADDALYFSKSNGRNQVHLYDKHKNKSK